MNIDGSSRGNSGHAGIGGVGRNSGRDAIFFLFFLFIKGCILLTSHRPSLFCMLWKEHVLLDGRRLFVSPILRLWWT